MSKPTRMNNINEPVAIRKQIKKITKVNSLIEILTYILGTMINLITSFITKIIAQLLKLAEWNINGLS